MKSLWFWTGFESFRCGTGFWWLLVGLTIGRFYHLAYDGLNTTPCVSALWAREMGVLGRAGKALYPLLTDPPPTLRDFTGINTGQLQGRDYRVFTSSLRCLELPGSKL